MAREDPGFLGRGWAFPPLFDAATGEAALVSTEDDITQSLRILFETRPGERVMHPSFGCRIHDYLFEPMTPATMRKMEAAIARAILFFEARIKVHEIAATVTNAPEGRMQVEISYTIVQTNSRYNAVFPFYITEGTLIADTPVGGALG